MLFNTPFFVFLFLPVSFIVYFWLNQKRLIWVGKAWLVAASLFFYISWNFAYLPLLLGSIVFNYAIGSSFSKKKSKNFRFSRRLILIFRISINLILLAYFKYFNFLIDNTNVIFSSSIDIPKIVLPLGISFFTFTQIAYLVDSYKGEVKEYNFINYALFVTYFPHLIAGPILHHREMMSQFDSRWSLVVRYRNVLSGLFIFSVGLFKKVIIADTFSVWANFGFDNGINLDFVSAWCTSLSYTFQLYFDFSGYCDMAIGASLLFNIWLPINFNSPYKALNIKEFWRKWHITLSRFLKDYLFIPLGGNRCSTIHIYLNLMITFILGGLWHGASWMFVIWGTLHGLALVTHRLWNSLGFYLPKPIAWLLTFNFINFTWVFFRAKNLDDALRIIIGMTNINSILNHQATLTSQGTWGGTSSVYLLEWLPRTLAANILCLISVLLAFYIISQKNSFELMKERLSNRKLSAAFLLFCIAMYSIMITKSQVFLYFNF